MKLPRLYRWLIVTVLVVLGVPLTWIVYNVNWAKQRHAFLNEPPMPTYSTLYKAAPWPLDIFGERGIYEITIHDEAKAAVAHRLFPEADLMTYDKQSPSGIKILFLTH